MKKYLIFILIYLIMVFNTACTQKNNMKTMKFQPPKAKKIKKELSIHGHTRIDNYYWLNDKENPKVIEYLNAENAYKDSVMKHTEPLQKKLYDEIIGRIKQNDKSVPYFKNGFFYYTRYKEDNEHPIFCRKAKNLENNEEILLDVNKLASGHAYYRVGDFSISPNNNLIAYGVDTVSRRKYTIYIKNLTTGKISKDQIDNTTGSSVWANDNKTIFYTRKEEETLREYKIFKHKLGTDINKDNVVFHETDDTFGTFVYKTKSQKYIIIGSYSTLSTEYRFLDADTPDSKFKIIQAREHKLEYSVDHFKDKFYIRTNWDATNFRLMETPVDKTTKENWKEIIAHREDVLLEGVEIFKNFIVIDERQNGLTQLRIINNNNKSEHYINFGESAYTAAISVNYEFDTQILRYKYSSLTTPASTYDYDMVSKEKQLLKQQEVVGNFSSNNYQTERLYATAKDGTKIPVSIVYRKGLNKNGDNPLLLYAYGSYGYSIDPTFSAERLSLIDRGFVYAIAHIRGGQIMGRKWYEDGKLLNKKNTFTDFNDCAQFLIAEKFTSSNKLFAMGGSAGGLLMGAIANIRPDLYKGIIAAVPFVDVVTTMLDESIPLTTGEFDEWGNPKDKEYYDYMLSYSPYDNVEAKDYPAMLITTGLHDSQVQYYEPAKWVAKLRDMKTNNNRLLIDIDMKVGHGGASGRFEYHKITALEYAFMLDLIGIDD